MAETYDAVIVGAGIAGASLAAELATGMKVLLVEQEARPGMHATGRSAAIFHLTYGGPPLQPLSAASLERLSRLDPAFWPHPVLSPRGILMIADKTCDAQLAEHVAASRQSLVHIPLEEAQRRFPLIRREVVTAAALDAGGQDIDVDALHQGYLRAFATRGGRLRCDSALRTATRSGGGWNLTIGSEQVGAGLLINAAGAWGDAVAALAGVRPIGLRPKRRTASLIDAPANADRWPMVIDAAETFYVKPDAGRLLLSPAEETDVDPHDAAADDYALAEGAERMSHYLDWEVRRRPQAWAGLRTFTPDRIPAIGFAPDEPGFFWLVGQGGYGVQTAPGVAALAAALITGAGGGIPVEVDHARYDPARFAWVTQRE